MVATPPATRVSSWRERADRDDGDAVGADVAVARAGDHAEHGGLPRPAGVDGLPEPQQRRCAFVDEAGAELDLEGRPSSVDELDDGVDLRAVIVPVVEHLAVEGWAGRGGPGSPGTRTAANQLKSKNLIQH